MKYESYFQRDLSWIEEGLEQALPPSTQYPDVIHEAMRYACFPGGKRFRPVLTLAACEACGGDPKDAVLAAVAVELIHSYSLVHDDLPSMDDDDTRRGKPSCHKRFGESVAILTGDGLLTLAFQILSHIRPAKKAVRLVEEVSTASGTYGMIAGQVAELGATRDNFNLPMLDYINIHKTGKLIKASAFCGAIVAETSKTDEDRISRYGEYLGLAFQSIDDLVDGNGYARLIQAKEIRQKARDLIAKAKRLVRPLERKGQKLIVLADFLLQRIPRRSHVKVD